MGAVTKRELLLGASSLALGGWTHGSNESLANMVGVVPARINMVNWTDTATYTDYTVSYWQKSNSSISTGFSDPSGGSNAQKLVEDVSNSTHQVISPNGADARAIQPNTVSPIPFRIACIAKAGERTRIVLELQKYTAAVPDPNAKASAGFDLANGVTSYDDVSTAKLTNAGSTIRALGSGWYLCYFDAVYNLATAEGFNAWEYHVYLDNGSGSAARSVTYAGNGTSGAYLFWSNELPAAAWTITRQVFFDDFTSSGTIDLTDSRAPGFNWYLHNLFPNAGMGPPWTDPAQSPPTQASWITVSNSIMTLVNPNNNQPMSHSQLNTIADIGVPGSYVGQTWQRPMLVEASINFDGSAAAWKAYFAAFQTCAFWCIAKEGLVQNDVNDVTEWDILEWATPDALGQDGTSTIRTWDGITSPPITQTAIGSGFDNMTVPLGTFRRISGLWLSIASTGAGWGIVMSFLNGKFIHISDKIYNSSSVVFPGDGGSHGAFQTGDTQHYPILIWTPQNITANAGGGFSVSYDWVRVYTP